MPKEILISEASEARTMAESLIPQYHPHLLDARIMYLFTTAKRKKCDRVKLGSAKKFSAMERYLSSRHFIGTRDPAIELGADFLILIDIEEWALLTPEQRLALVDHELCLPAGVKVTGPQVEASSMRWYTGELVEIATASGYFLAGTPNHPILTDDGWIPLDLLHKGDYVVSCRDPERIAATMDPNEYQMPSTIEQIAGTQEMILGLMPKASENLNPNMPYSQIKVVPANGLLLDGLISTLLEHGLQVQLNRRDTRQMSLARQGKLPHGVFLVFLTTPGVLGESNTVLQRSPFVRPSEADFLPIRSITDRDIRLLEMVLDDATIDTGMVGQNVQRLPSKVLLDEGIHEPWLQQRRRVGDPARFDATAQMDAGTTKVIPDRRVRDAINTAEFFQRCSSNVLLDEIVHVQRYPFRGHVYNLQTIQGWYSANHILTHNCHMWRFEKIVKDQLVGYWGIRGHDFEGFLEEVKRHGYWKSDIQAMGSVMQQIALPLA